MRGWGPASNTRKWHYFVDGRSLCGRYLKFNPVGLEDDLHDSPDNCSECKVKRQKRYQKLKEEKNEK